MKPGWIFVLIVGIAIFPPVSAQTNLWRINSPMDFTSGPEVNVNNLKIWTINSSMQFIPTLTPGVAKGITLTPGIAKGITLTPGIAKGITLTPGVAKGVTLSPGVAKGITLTPGIDKGINKTLFMCNIV
jgi:hypothetical protein